MKLVIHLPSRFEANVEYSPENRTLEITPKLFPYSMYVTRETGKEVVDTHRLLLSRSPKGRLRLNPVPANKSADETPVLSPEKPSQPESFIK